MSGHSADTKQINLLPASADPAYRNWPRRQKPSKLRFQTLHGSKGRTQRKYLSPLI